MNADDPRHGTAAGASQHQRDAENLCDPCRKAANRNRKRYRYLAAVGKNATIDAAGLRRRVRALQALGWTLPQIAGAADLSFSTLLKPLYRSATCRTQTARAVARAYDRLCMTLPPERTAAERRNAAYARNLARKHGWAPPLAYDDIDDPDERPRGVRGKWAADYDSRELVDDATVTRILAGERLPANELERVEALSRWLSAGNSERSLCQVQGWKTGRYSRVTSTGEGAA